METTTLAFIAMGLLFVVLMVYIFIQYTSSNKNKTEERKGSKLSSSSSTSSTSGPTFKREASPELREDIPLSPRSSGPELNLTDAEFIDPELFSEARVSPDR
ncbi:SDA1 [White spot syndrome virus]|uniref:Wsv284 n=2 Tax=White spot syndrome virus TaxID=342409 RepID=A0A2U9GG61_WSSV|nr:SDA1 [White spot syndrome virus]AWQ60416.1 wsv284 [Shrimp white spot syndrome virus]AWQ60860.1 wsv284 [Shrimp white spot syndrome virus]AWQ61278.1 wsv284 [Shrimp white spot syndrome virus]AWQ61717.1 wsv284 [Shrimp white spot syndrome virus]